MDNKRMVVGRWGGVTKAQLGAIAKRRGNSVALSRAVYRHSQEREFRAFLRCGLLVHGFLRIRCDDCAFERLLPLSCKGRVDCASCGGRRMAEQAANLLQADLPWAPVRQWVLTVPHRLRYRLAFDHALCQAVGAAFVRAGLGWNRRRARHARQVGR